MSNDRNFIGFVDQYVQVLELSKVQRKRIQALEDHFMQSCISANASDPASLNKFFQNKIEPLLTTEQFNRLGRHVIDRQLKERGKRIKSIKKAYKKAHKKLANLQLSEGQLLDYAEIRVNWTNLMIEQLRHVGSLSDFDVEKQERVLVEEYIYPIFSADQIKEFDAISETQAAKRKQKALAREQKQFKAKYGVSLSDEQVAELFRNKRIAPLRNAEGEFYSAFEVMELEIDRLRKVLTPKQFKKIAKVYQIERRGLEKHLQQVDRSKHQRRLDREKGQYKYFKKELYPSLLRIQQKVMDQLPMSQKEEIARLRDQYRALVQDEFQESKATHKRLYEDNCPNALKAIKVRRNMGLIEPNATLLSQIPACRALVTAEVRDLIQKEMDSLEAAYEAYRTFKANNYRPEAGHIARLNAKLFSPSEEEGLKYTWLLMIADHTKDKTSKSFQVQDYQL